MAKRYSITFRWFKKWCVLLDRFPDSTNLCEGFDVVTECREPNCPALKGKEIRDD